MSKNKTERKNANKGLVMLAILLIILITVFSSIGYYAWARYRSSAPGEATAQVAKWHFELTPGEEDQTPRANFVMTRTDGYGNVVEGTLAPGTFGEIPVFVDMTRTEVLTKLELTFTIKDCPRNIKFYASEADRTNNKPMKITQTRDGNNKYVTTIEVTKYYTIEDETADDYVGKVHNETIYWKWAYETLDSENSSTVGDEKDKEDSGKEAQIVITARATEVLEKALTLKDVDIKVGDTINYTKENTEIKGIVVNKTADEVEFMPIDSTTNKALLVGNVRLGYNEGTTANTEQAQTEAIASWNNAEQSVNKEATDNYSLASRALTVEDVNRLTGFNPEKDYPSIKYNYTYNSSASSPRRFIVNDEMKVKLSGESDFEKAITIKKSETENYKVGDTISINESVYGGKTVQEIKMVCTEGANTNAYYNYNSNSTAKSKLSQYFGSTSFWLASRCLYFSSDNCDFGVRYCSSGSVDRYSLYDSNGNTYSYPRPVVPVVRLSSDIQVKAGATSGVWEVNE